MARVMICDDAAFVRGAIGKIVTAAGHTVVTGAGTGLEAVKNYKAFHPDLVFMDITMPDMDGIQATMQIKEYDPNAKVIMVSSLGHTDKVVKAINAGAKDFIVKPFDEEHIEKCIDKYA